MYRERFAVRRTRRVPLPRNSPGKATIPAIPRWLAVLAENAGPRKDVPINNEDPFDAKGVLILP